MININTRIRTIIDTLYKGNKRAFSITIGVNPTVIENIVGGRRSKPSYDVLCKIITNANISEQWLISGTGPMLKNEDKTETSNPISPALSTSSTQKGIPLIPFSAMAGYLSGEASVSEDECEKIIIPGLKADFIIPIKGDSMEPRFFAGDYVACERTSIKDLFFQWGKTYVIDTTNGVFIKRVDEGSSKNEILLVSENKKYKPMPIPTSSILHIALVKGVVRIE